MLAFYVCVYIYIYFFFQNIQKVQKSFKKTKKTEQDKTAHKFSRNILSQVYIFSQDWRLSWHSPRFPALESTRVYFEGPSPDADFAVDDASVLAETCQCSVPLTSQEVIEQIRKSDINIE